MKEKNMDSENLTPDSEDAVLIERPKRKNEFSELLDPEAAKAQISAQRDAGQAGEDTEEDLVEDNLDDKLQEVDVEFLNEEDSTNVEEYDEQSLEDAIESQELSEKVTDDEDAPIVIETYTPMVTPAFRKAFGGGYKKDEVDNYSEKTTIQYNILLSAKSETDKRNSELEKLTVEMLADERIAEADAKAGQILADAEVTAEEIREASKQEAEDRVETTNNKIMELVEAAKNEASEIRKEAEEYGEVYINNAKEKQAKADELLEEIKSQVEERISSAELEAEKIKETAEAYKQAMLAKAEEEIKAKVDELNAQITKVNEFILSKQAINNRLLDFHKSQIETIREENSKLKPEELL
jgi:hypothetical protein